MLRPPLEVIDSIKFLNRRPSIIKVSSTINEQQGKIKKKYYRITAKGKVKGVNK
jgi:hypothetical protein